MHGALSNVHPKRPAPPTTTAARGRPTSGSSTRGRALGIHAHTSFPRLSSLTDPYQSASAGPDQTHELQCLVKLPPRVLSSVHQAFAADGRPPEGFQVSFYTSRIALVSVPFALSPRSLLAFPAILFDLPTLSETVKAYGGDHSQYYKVADLSQLLYTFDIYEDAQDRAIFAELPVHIREQVDTLLASNQQVAAKGTPLATSPISDYTSDSTSVSRVFMDEVSWALWPHGITTPMYNIRARKKQVLPSAKIQMSASQTAETVENIVKRLLDRDEQSAGVRVSIVQLKGIPAAKAAELPPGFAPRDEHMDRKRVVYERGFSRDHPRRQPGEEGAEETGSSLIPGLGASLEGHLGGFHDPLPMEAQPGESSAGSGRGTPSKLDAMIKRLLSSDEGE